MKTFAKLFFRITRVTGYAVALLAALAGTATVARALGSITVPNYSFEDPVTVDFAGFSGADWQLGANISSAGVINFDAVSSSYSVDAPPDGSQIGFLNDNGTAGIYQDLSTDYVVGDMYTLSIYFGTRNDDLGAAGEISLEDPAGNVLATSGSFAPASGTFQQVSINNTATLAEAGQPIRIQIANTGAVQVNFDDVQLVPEPSTYAWWAGVLGLGVMGFRKLRRRLV